MFSLQYWLYVEDFQCDWVCAFVFIKIKARSQRGHKILKPGNEHLSAEQLGLEAFIDEENSIQLLVNDKERKLVNLNTKMTLEGIYEKNFIH